MNITRKHILKGALVIALLMVIYPPKYIGVVPLEKQVSEYDPGAMVVMEYGFILGSRLGHTSDVAMFSYGIAWDRLALQFQWLLLITLTIVILYRFFGREGLSLSSAS